MGSSVIESLTKMKVSVILLLISVSWVVAFPGQKWNEEEEWKGGKEGGWLGGNRGGQHSLGGLGGLLQGGEKGEGHLDLMLGKGKINPLELLTKGEGGDAILGSLGHGHAKGGENLLWNGISKVISSKGGDENILSKLKGILEKGNLIRDQILKIVISKDGEEDILSKLRGIVEQDKRSWNSIEKKILILVTSLLKGEGHANIMETIKILLEKLSKGGSWKDGHDSGWSTGGKGHGGSGVHHIEGSLKIKIIEIIEKALEEKMKSGGSWGKGKGKWGWKEMDWCKKELLKKVTKQIHEKKMGGTKLEETEILKITKEVVEKESDVVIEKSWHRRHRHGGGKSSEESHEESSGSSSEKSSGSSCEKSSGSSSEESSGKCSSESSEKSSSSDSSGKKSKESSGKSSSDSSGKSSSDSSGKSSSESSGKSSKESGGKSSKESNSKSSEESHKKRGKHGHNKIEIHIKKQVTKITKEKLIEELKLSGALGKGKEELSLEELTKCNELIWEKVQKQIGGWMKGSKKIEETELTKIVEEVIKTEIKSGTIIEIIGGNKKGGHHGKHGGHDDKHGGHGGKNDWNDDKHGGHGGKNDWNDDKHGGHGGKNDWNDDKHGGHGGKNDWNDDKHGGHGGKNDWNDDKKGGHGGKNDWNDDKKGGHDNKNDWNDDKKGGHDDKNGGHDDKNGGHDKKNDWNDDKNGGHGGKNDWNDDKKGGHDDKKGGHDDKKGGHDDKKGGHDGKKDGNKQNNIEIEVTIKEEITKITEEKVIEELKRSGKGKEKLNEEERKLCRETILKQVEEQILVKNKGAKKLEKGEILKIAEEVIQKELKEGTLLKLLETSGKSEEGGKKKEDSKDWPKEKDGGKGKKD